MNLPSTINAAGQSSTFAYGPNRNRWRQVASYPSGTETTIYVGGILEKVTVPSGTAFRHYIGAGSAQVIYTRWSTGTINTKYVTSDHLGSSTAVMDGSGASLVNLSFGSFGARRGSAWTGTPSAGDWTQIANATRQGFTGHEGLDNVNLIHMNGRVFEPVLGRFLSADPFTPASLGSQAPNRFAYVGNSPLSLIDPSGFQERDVTEAQPTPRNLCPFQIANIGVSCTYRFGWRWDRDPYYLWLLTEYQIESSLNERIARIAASYTPPGSQPQPRPAPAQPPIDEPLEQTGFLDHAYGFFGYSRTNSSCGPEGSATLQFPNAYGDVNYNEACVTHDLCYSAASFTPRDVCDANLVLDIISEFVDAHPTNSFRDQMYRYRGLQIARTYYVGVWLFGRREYEGSESPQDPSIPPEH